MKYLFFLITIVSAMLTVGCGTHNISSTPSGAHVYAVADSRVKVHGVTDSAGVLKPENDLMIDLHEQTPFVQKGGVSKTWYQVRKEGYRDSEIIPLEFPGNEALSYHFDLIQVPEVELLLQKVSDNPDDFYANYELMTYYFNNDQLANSLSRFLKMTELDLDSVEEDGLARSAYLLLRSQIAINDSSQLTNLLTPAVTSIIEKEDDWYRVILLHSAINYNSIDCVEYFLNRNVPVTKIDADGYTSIYAAVRATLNPEYDASIGNQIFTMLIEYGATSVVNKPWGVGIPGLKDGITPLQEALSLEEYDFAIRLVDVGANTDVPYKGSDTILSFFEVDSNEKLIEKLRTL